MDNLSIDETKLYLILLANSGDSGEGRILLKVINGVLGEGFPIHRLKAACSKLTECGLIEFSSSSLEEVKGDNSKLVYRITPEKQRG